MNTTTHICPHCKTKQEALFLFKCVACGFPNVTETKNPFDFFEVEKKFDINLEALEEKYYKISKTFHPDRFSQKGTEFVNAAEKISSTANYFYEVLRSDEFRIELLISLQQEAAKELKTPIPLELSEAFFELQELKFENPEQFKEAKKTLESQVDSELKHLLNQRLNLAKKINWNKALHDEIAGLLKLKSEIKYRESLLENINKL